MKKSLVILLAAVTFASCGTKPEATIEGTVSGIADGTKVYLLDNARARLDSATVASGKFRFEIAKAYPDMFALSFDGKPGRFPFIVEPGNIIATLSFDPWSELFIGTPTNDAIKAVNDGIAPLNEKANEIEEKLNALETEGKSSGTPEFDSLLAVLYSIFDEQQQYARNAALQTPASLFTACMAGSTSYALTTPAEVDSVLTLIADAPANAFTDRLRERHQVLALTAVGAEAPDFSQAQPDGTPLSLSSLRGKLVLIDFWASWCGPCRRENPNVVKMYERFRDRGFEIVGVSLDDSREDWLDAIEEDGLGWVHVSDLGGWQNAVAQQYAVQAIPHTVLVGADGVIIAKNLRGAALEAKVAEILGE